PGLVSKNTISNVVAHSATNGAAIAINLANVGNGMEIQNNFIHSIRNNRGDYAQGRGAIGIKIFSGSNHKIYHNSINLFHTISTANVSFSACITMESNLLTGIDIRNNILSNTVSGGTATDVNVCLYF